VVPWHQKVSTLRSLAEKLIDGYCNDDSSEVRTTVCRLDHRWTTLLHRFIIAPATVSLPRAEATGILNVDKDEISFNLLPNTATMSKQGSTCRKNRSALLLSTFCFDMLLVWTIVNKYCDNAVVCKLPVLRHFVL